MRLMIDIGLAVLVAVSSAAGTVAAVGYLFRGVRPGCEPGAGGNDVRLHPPPCP
jgi:hypothetical protein